MLNKYILIGRYPVAIEDNQLLQWGTWFGLHPRHVAFTEIKPRKPFRKGGKRMLNRVNHIRKQRVIISTIFLALDHNYFGGEPILFETWVRGGLHHDFMCRYHTIDDALDGHNELVKLYEN